MAQTQFAAGWPSGFATPAVRGVVSAPLDREHTVTLLELPTGQPAYVVSVEPPRDAEAVDIVMRLAALGFLPGEPVRVVAVGRPGREPLAVRLAGTTFALRRFEAAHIRVTTDPARTDRV